MNNWIVFDYGEVISHPNWALPDLAERLGVAQSTFEPAYWAERDPYDRGCADLDFWRAVGGRLGLDVDEATSRALTAIDNDGWLSSNEETLALLDDLTRSGARLALLSNAPVSFARAAERQEWTKHFSHLVFSGDLGVAKPDPEIWAALVDRLDTEPANCLFVDDRQVNVDGARAAGLRAELWSTATELGPQLLRFATCS